MENVELLISSACAGDLNAVRKLLNKGVPVNAQDSEGVSALQAASVNGRDDIVKFLLYNSADVDLPNAYGWTPLMLAAKHGHTSTLSVLLKHRARVNIFNKFGLTPIAVAVSSGNISVVNLLLEAGAVIREVPSSEIRPSEGDLVPVMVASFLGHDTILQQLLEWNAPVNHQSAITGWSPLMLAVCNGHIQTVQILLRWGADINVIDICRRNAMDIAVLRRQWDVKVLLENLLSTRPKYASGKETDLLEAVRNGNSFLVEAILKKHKQCANAIDSVDGISALMIASMLGCMDIVQSLIYSGADVNAQDTKKGWTALMHATFYKQLEIVKCLLEKGADVSLCAHNGHTALDLAKYLDDCDSDIISALKSKMEAADSSTLDEMPLNALLPTLPQSKTSFLDGGTPKKASQGSRMKGWFGEVASRLQTKIASRTGFRSHRSTCTSPMAFVTTTPISVADSSDEVFDSSSTSNASSSRAMLNISALKSPSRYLVNNMPLVNNTMPVTPPLLGSPCQNIKARDVFSSKNISLAQKTKHEVVSLRTPNLLRSYSSNLTSELKDYVGATALNSMGEGKSKCGLEKQKQARASDLGKINLQGSTAAGIESPLESPSVEVECCMSDSHSSSQSLNTLGGLAEILKSESLQKHVEKFKNQEVDLEAFKCLTEDDLDEIGIVTNMSREKLLEIINNLNACDMNKSIS